MATSDAQIIEASFKSLSSCAQVAVAHQAHDSGCDIDIRCICTSRSFQSFLLYDLPDRCDVMDINATHAIIGPLCLDAFPSLYDDKRADILITISILMALAIVAVGLRFLARRLSTIQMGLDDAMILLALILTCGINVASLAAVRHGYGLHSFRLDMYQINNFNKANFAVQLLLGPATTAIKISILLFYDRIFQTPTFRRISMGTGASMLIWCLVLFVGVLKGSTPTAYFWDITIKGGHEVHKRAMGEAMSAINVITDVIVLLLPVPWLLGLKGMDIKKKIAIIVVFIAGGFACISAVVRIPLIAEVKLWDITFSIKNVGIWIAVETNLGIVSACLPVIQPLFKKIHWPTAIFMSSKASSFGGSSTSMKRLFANRASRAPTANAETTGMAEEGWANLDQAWVKKSASASTIEGN